MILAPLPYILKPILFTNEISKNLVKNATKIAHEIIKLRLQILEALHVKKKYNQ